MLDDVKLAPKKLHDADLIFKVSKRVVLKSRGKGEEEWRVLLVDFNWLNLSAKRTMLR